MNRCQKPGRPSIALIICLAAVIPQLLVACARPQPIVSQDVRLSVTNGYISGIFSGHAAAFGFAFVNTATQEEYFMPLFKGKNFLLKEQPLQMTMIEVPPGVYELAYWASYDSFTFDISAKKEIPKSSRLSFEVTPSRIVFFGRFLANELNDRYGVSWEVERVETNEDEVRQFLQRTYPHLSHDDLWYYQFEG